MQISEKELTDLGVFANEIKDFLNKMENFDKSEESVLIKELSNFEREIVESKDLSNRGLINPRGISLSNELLDDFSSVEELLGDEEKKLFEEYQKAEGFLDQRYELKLAQLEQVNLLKNVFKNTHYLNKTGKNS